MGRALGTPAVTNLWVPDGMKDTPAEFDHTSGIFVKDAAGKLRLWWRNDISVEDMEHDLRLLLGSAR